MKEAPLADAPSIRERWRVVKAAGIAIAGGSPSRSEYERSKAILEKRALEHAGLVNLSKPANVPDHPLTMLDSALNNLRQRLSEINEAEVKLQELIGQKSAVLKQIAALETARDVITEPETITGL